MSVAFPWVLWGTIGAVVGVVVAHLLSVTQPRALWLPTSRFVPDRAVRAVSRANTPRDVPLLMVRVLLLLCIGCALAGVTWLGARRESVRTMLAIDGRAIVAGDRVLLVRAITDALQRAARNNAPVRAVLLGDTLVHVSDPALAAATLDSVMRARPGRASSSLGATLLRARRAAPALANGADSVALVVMSLERADVTAAALSRFAPRGPVGSSLSRFLRVRARTTRRRGEIRYSCARLRTTWWLRRTNGGPILQPLEHSLSATA